MNLQPRTTDYAASREFLRNAVGLEYKTAGATLDGGAFAAIAADNDGVVPAGTAVFLGDNGLYQPWDDTADTGTAATAEGAGLTAHDCRIVDGGNAVVGVLAAGHPRRDRCIGVNDAFVEATRGRLVFDI